MIASRTPISDGSRTTLRGLRRELREGTLNLDGFARGYAVDKLTDALHETVLAREIARKARASERDAMEIESSPFREMSAAGERYLASMQLKASAGGYIAVAKELVALGDTLRDNGVHKYNVTISKMTVWFKDAALAHIEHAERIYPMGVRVRTGSR